MTAATHVPPQNIEAEKALLGALLVTDAAWAAVTKSGLLPDDLYLPKHQLVYAAIAELATRAAPCDEIAVADALDRAGRLDEAGGRNYIGELCATVPAASNAGHYAAIILAHAVERGKGEIGRELTNGLGPPEAIERLRKLERRRAGIAGGLAVRGADLSRVRPVRWLWDRRLLLGYLCLLLGAEGMGKGTVAAWLIARLTKGELPGDLEGVPARVLVLGDEDAFDSVWVPRLHAQTPGTSSGALPTSSRAGSRSTRLPAMPPARQGSPRGWRFRRAGCWPRGVVRESTCCRPTQHRPGGCARGGCSRTSSRTGPTRRRQSGSGRR
jgi:hypothetical protein